MDKIKIVLIDDHSILRETLVIALNMEAGFEVVGHWDNAEDGLKFFETASADVAVVDNKLPGMNGIVFTRKLKAVNPAVKILLLSMITKEDKVFEALESGASGYLPKEVSISELIQAIKNIHNGDIYLDNTIMKNMVTYFAQLKDPSLKKSLLSAEQITILNLAADGMTNKEIADRLDINLPTVKLRFQEIFKLLDARHRTHAIVKAAKLGILSLED
jgi:DNA-binding NarL/FixJ family response regulator